MTDPPPNPIRRTSSVPFPDRLNSSRQPSLQQFADDARHVLHQDRDRVYFVAEPEELRSYEPVGDGRHGHVPVLLPVGRVGTGYARSQYAYSQSMPRDPAASSEFAWTGRDTRGRRPTKDSSISDHNRSYDPNRSERVRVRFVDPSDRTRRTYSRSSSRSFSPPSRSYSGSDSDPGSYPRHKPYPSLRNSYTRDPDSELDTEEEVEEGFDELIGGKVFQFVPSRASRTLAKSGHSTESDTSLERPEDGFSGARGDPNFPGSSDVLHVFQSQYTGDAVSDGTHTAKLTVIHDPKKQRQPLFRWVHLEQRMMNLDELSTEIARIPAITDSERNGFAKLLAEVKKTSVKVRPTAKGNNVRHMDPKPIRVAIPPDGRTKGQASRFVTWLCVPYFSLEKYSGLLSASTASSFPIETLLQSDYARTTQERDMQQAVCKNGEVPDGYCFHIAQLWCIVLDNTLLITCGRMSGSTLRGDLVRIVNEPLKDSIGKGKKVYISYYDTVLWELPLESCLTWFDFSIHFREFWPQAIRIYHHGRVLTETDWPRIVNLVRNVNIRVILDLRLWIHPSPPAVGVLKSLDKETECTEDGELARNGKAKNTKVQPVHKDDGKFHVFSWLEIGENEGDGIMPYNVEQLTTSLREIEEYLITSTGMRDRSAYRNCEISSRRSVHAYLSQGSGIEKAEELDWQKNEYEKRVDLYNAADIIFDFFLPQYVDESTPTIGKFWGAIDSLVQNTDQDPNNESRKSSRRHAIKAYKAYTNMIPLRSALRGLTRGIQSFRDILSHMSTSMRSKVEIPDSLVRAWLHLVMALIQASQNEEAWNENMNVSEALIRRGMNQIMDELPTEDLLSSSVLQPMELVTLISSNLLKDSTGKYSSINDTYSDYLKGLENEITANNSDRSHQFRITLFRQEVAVIRRVIASQLNVVDGMTVPQRPSWGDQTRRERKMLEEAREKLKPEAARIRSGSSEKQGATYVDKLDGYDSYNHYYNSYPRSVLDPPGAHFMPVRHPDTFSKLTSTDPGGFRELLGRECKSWLERRNMEFLELEVEASRLEMMNANKIEVTKDRQEAAVYAFTMVTIIFLPLSTISSIFGMNSSDVRDMELGQWAYWAAALPTTIAVIIIGLWWMGELHNLVDWVRGLPSRSTSSRSHARVSRPAANGVIYYPQGEYPGRDPQQVMRPYSRAALGPPVPRTSWRY
ncbi:uncharacterized protein F4812DRAFT_110004 [Daldinia caldariorum]|uniref:uncharacterized protein n=1 Tax=Daldinia caldariorum TaxID=326644 RepID=UPI0020072C1C|nr:uncharacterized protein F4812DRAFT_110004 [Daldinia caldariorum]KAI1465730.1 hypothetical protein F4812DRAFT_110004 [Daldinia caldariorum]